MGIRLLGTVLIASILAGSAVNAVRAQDVQPVQPQMTAQPPHVSSKKAMTPVVSLQKFLSDKRPAKSLGVRELRLKLRAGRALIKKGKLSRADRRKVRVAMRSTRAQLFKLRPDLRKHRNKHKKHKTAELRSLHIA